MAEAKETAVRRMKKERKTATKFKDSFDPNGSYTGSPVDNEKPIQDVDDL